MLKRRFKEPFGKAGLTVAVIALVMALVSGAYAAGGLTKSQEKQVTKIAKKYAGKPGAPGAEGKQGPAGANGKDGAPGEPGANGKNGTNGKSIVTGNATSGECEEGGATVEVEGSPGTKKHVCNGSPWTAGGTLPKGQSEYGVWTLPFLHNPALPFTAGSGAVSFGIPLNSAPTLAFVNQAGEERVYGESPTEPGEFEWSSPGTRVNCLGSVNAPEAAKGFLCFYAEINGGNLGGTTLSHTVGALITMVGGSEGTLARGTWAVTSAG